MFELAENFTTHSFTKQRIMNEWGKNVIRKIDFSFNRVSTLLQVDGRMEQWFAYSSKTQKCYTSLGKFTNKNEKNCASWSKGDHQICGKSVWRKVFDLKCLLSL